MKDFLGRDICDGDWFVQARTQGRSSVGLHHYLIVESRPKSLKVIGKHWKGAQLKTLYAGANGMVIDPADVPAKIQKEFYDYYATLG